MSHDQLSLAAAIVDRGKGQKTAAAFREMQADLLLVIQGRGTASSALMDCLGLDEPEKDIVVGLTAGYRAASLLEALGEKLSICRPGHGIAFTLPLSGISLAVSRQIKSRSQEGSGPKAHLKEDIPMTEPVKYELVAAVINTDLSDPVMDAARRAGCGGGTLVKARDVGGDCARRIFGMTVAPEKEILFILLPEERKLAVLHAICDTIFKETGEHGAAFSLPVDAVAGLAVPQE